jgi:aminoacyl-tRNA hydrolase
VRAAWPDRLSFTAVFEGESVRVDTQFVGKYWVTSVLAALATGLALGVPLPEGARAVAGVAPFQARMSAVELPDGVTFLRDDWKASAWGVPAAFEIIREARAARKVIVVGTISDYPGAATRTYVRMAREALQVADHVCFVGPHGLAALRAKRHEGDDAIRAFGTVREASAHLREFLRPGDLVLLKGSNRADHLVRLVLDRTTGVQCWRSDCKRLAFCTTCALVHVPSAATDDSVPPSEGVVTSQGDVHMVVGLGNPGDRYADTPHNVGQRTVGLLAEQFGRLWATEGKARLCRIEWQGATVCLVQPLVLMNHVGAVLAEVGERLAVAPERCILVHDDLDLPLGKIRTRLNGSDGGHRGVRSVLQAFQDDTFPRVKIGVGRPPPGQTIADYVLSPIAADWRPVVDRACREAADRVLQMVRTSSPTAAVTPGDGSCRPR